MSTDSEKTDGGNAAGLVRVDSPNVKYTSDYIESTVEYPISSVVDQNNTIVVNVTIVFIVKTDVLANFGSIKLIYLLW